MGTSALALVPLDGELSDFASSRLTAAQFVAITRLGPARFRRWAEAGARSRSTP